MPYRTAHLSPGAIIRIRVFSVSEVWPAYVLQLWLAKYRFDRSLDRYRQPRKMELRYDIDVTTVKNVVANKKQEGPRRLKSLQERKKIADFLVRPLRFLKSQ